MLRDLALVTIVLTAFAGVFSAGVWVDMTYLSMPSECVCTDPVVRVECQVPTQVGPETMVHFTWIGEQDNTNYALEVGMPSPDEAARMDKDD